MSTSPSNEINQATFCDQCTVPPIDAPGEKSTTEWYLGSWRTKEIIEQQPEYKDRAALQKVLSRLKALPPLVHPNEVDSLKAKLADAASGRSFLIQVGWLAFSLPLGAFVFLDFDFIKGGDCAERFLDCNQEGIEKKIKVLWEMAMIVESLCSFTKGNELLSSVFCVARIAGQFAKPRSSPFEGPLPDGSFVASFKGSLLDPFLPLFLSLLICEIDA